MRKTQLSDRMKDGTLESICLVIRDLAFHSREQKLSESDTRMLERAESFLLDEWHLSLGVPLSQAREELSQVLRDAAANGP